jgi:transcriptional regulator with XRE-family HTH domain
VARRFGVELRIARMAAGLSQAAVARLAELSQTEVSRAERGALDVSLDARCRLVAATGHELSLRLYPVATVSLRDSGQLAIAQVIVGAVHPSWRPRLEVPVGDGSLRAADLVLERAEQVIQIEIERALVDIQAQLRAAELKRQALAQTRGRPVALVIGVPDTTPARSRLAEHRALLDATLPASSRDIWRAIRRGEPLATDGILFVRARRGPWSGRHAPD